MPLDCPNKVPPPKKVKIGPKTFGRIFIGYVQDNSEYRFIVHKSDVPNIQTNGIVESSNAVFFEDIFPWKRTRG